MRGLLTSRLIERWWVDGDRAVIDLPCSLLNLSALPYAPIVDARASARRGLHIAPGTAHNASLTVVNRAEVCYT